MREAQHLVEEVGGTVIGVGPREDYQAQRLLDDGMPFPLLLDPENLVRAAIGADQRFGWTRLLHPRGLLPYLRAIRSSGRFFDVSWSEATQHPGVVVLDAQLNVTWTHIGHHVGDYPSLDTVLTQLRRAA